MPSRRLKPPPNDPEDKSSLSTSPTRSPLVAASSGGCLVAPRSLEEKAGVRRIESPAAAAITKTVEAGGGGHGKAKVGVIAGRREVITNNKVESFGRESSNNGIGYTRNFKSIYDTSKYGTLNLNNGLARTPQMGWNSWNFFACNINQRDIEETADVLVSTGLANLGYVYVNIDDCWSSSTRDAKGQLVPDPKTFPSGIKALADYVHGKGLKLGPLRVNSGLDLFSMKQMTQNCLLLGVWII